MSLNFPVITELPCTTTIRSVERCATATCDDSGSVERCVDAGEFTLELTNPTEAEIAAAQAQVDAQALAAAQALADAGVPHITSGTPPAAQNGIAYTFQFTADGGTAPYTFEITSGDLPDGLTMDGDGLISGTPTESGSFSITVTVTDSSP